MWRVYCFTSAGCGCKSGLWIQFLRELRAVFRSCKEKDTVTELPLINRGWCSLSRGWSFRWTLQIHQKVFRISSLWNRFSIWCFIQNQETCSICHNQWADSTTWMWHLQPAASNPKSFLYLLLYICFCLCEALWCKLVCF